MDYYNSIKEKGDKGETELIEKLKGIYPNCALYRNVYLNDADNRAEADVIMVNEYGVFVFEMKNYSGWIFGGEWDETWTVSYKSGKKFKMKNPIIQNYKHQRMLARLIDVDEAKVKAIVVFGNEAEFKQISVNYSSVFFVDEIYRLKNNYTEKILKYEELTNIQTAIKKLEENSRIIDEIERQKDIESYDEENYDWIHTNTYEEKYENKRLYDIPKKGNNKPANDWRLKYGNFEEPPTYPWYIKWLWIIFISIFGCGIPYFLLIIMRIKYQEKNNIEISTIDKLLYLLGVTDFTLLIIRLVVTEKTPIAILVLFIVMSLFKKRKRKI